MKRPLMTLIFLLATGVSAATADDTVLRVERDRALLRKGPGSDHETLALLPKGTALILLQQTGSWHKVRQQELTGYVSAKVTQPSPPRQDIFSRMAVQPASLRLMRHGMSAGAKGFATRFSRRLKGDSTLVDRAIAYRIDPKAYRSFKQTTLAALKPRNLWSRFPIPAQATRSHFTALEQGLGLGIATKIATLNLYENPSLQDYINFVGNLVVEASHAYDLPFKFFVIDSPLVNAYACPGGFIFITKGMLQLIQNEAELAAVLAHEITHVAFYHGLQELSRRKPLVIAENAFAELDESASGTDDESFDAIEAELDDFALDVYETIFAGRLSRYEFEADAMGMRYSARSGYDPLAMATLLQRLIDTQSVSTNEHYTPQQNKNRMDRLKAASASKTWQGSFMQGQSRWQKYLQMMN